MLATRVAHHTLLDFLALIIFIFFLNHIVHVLIRINIFFWLRTVLSHLTQNCICPMYSPIIRLLKWKVHLS